MIAKVKGIVVHCADAAASSIILERRPAWQPTDRFAAVNLNEQNISKYQEFTIPVARSLCLSPACQRTRIFSEVNLLPVRAAAIASALIIVSCKASAVTFDERWSSLFGVSQITSESVSAKAELVRPKAFRRTVERRSRFKRQRAREWYKGGKRWHYVYSRKRGR